MTTTEYKNATWASLKDGSWGLRIQAEVTEGEIVKAQTRGGKTTYETVGKIVWVGRSNVTDGSVDYTLASLGPKPEIKKPRAPRKVSKKLLQKATDEYIDVATAVEIYGKDDLPY